MAERKVVAAACLALSPLFAHGDVTPARLREDKYSIESLLEVPGDLEHRRYDVHCDVHVQSTGRPGYCAEGTAALGIVFAFAGTVITPVTRAHP